MNVESSRSQLAGFFNGQEILSAPASRRGFLWERHHRLEFFGQNEIRGVIPSLVDFGPCYRISGQIGQFQAGNNARLTNEIHPGRKESCDSGRLAVLDVASAKTGQPIVSELLVDCLQFLVFASATAFGDDTCDIRSPWARNPSWPAD